MHRVHQSSSRLRILDRVGNVAQSKGSLTSDLESDISRFDPKGFSQRSMTHRSNDFAFAFGMHNSMSWTSTHKAQDHKDPQHRYVRST